MPRDYKLANEEHDRLSVDFILQTHGLSSYVRDYFVESPGPAREYRLKGVQTLCCSLFLLMARTFWKFLYSSFAEWGKRCIGEIECKAAEMVAMGWKSREERFCRPKASFCLALETGVDSGKGFICEGREERAENILEIFIVMQTKEFRAHLDICTRRFFEMPLPRVKIQPHVFGITPEKARRWAPSVIGFGASTGVLVALFAEAIPRFRRDVLERVPVVGEYWKRKEPVEAT
ncbi:hypothetical protein G9A89_014705 [Geosiphon pyriformis]|nr:hypothetical protein G9A89_014705 [Geosiphon pyriformis]